MLKPSNLPRIYVLLAREAPVGVIIRRGPSRRVHLVLWQTDADTFEPGQWLSGRIYERRCDLSPSGKYFIYAVAKYDYGKDLLTWTAISRPPYFTAIALWNRTADIGGGFFESDEEVIINQCLFWEDGGGKRELPIIKVGMTTDRGWEQTELMLQRHVRNGWQIVEDKNQIDKILFKSHQYFNDGEIFLYQHIRNYYHSGRSKEDYTLADNEGKVLVEMEKLDWADLDKNGDLLFSKEGKIFRLSHLDEAPYLPPIENAKELLDLSKYSFQKVPPPDWAREW